jgi:nucleoid DNA-binding protein
MAHKPPIQLSQLAKKGVLNEDTFFRLLSEQNNYVDSDSIKDFYMGLVRLITNELRKNGVATLPHLGVFALVKQKDRVGLAGQFKKMIVGKYVLKFYPKEAWRKYFSQFEQRSGREGMLDPREKVLGNTLE